MWNADKRSLMNAAQAAIYLCASRKIDAHLHQFHSMQACSANLHRTKIHILRNLQQVNRQVMAVWAFFYFEKPTSTIDRVLSGLKKKALALESLC